MFMTKNIKYYLNYKTERFFSKNEPGRGGCKYKDWTLAMQKPKKHF